MLKRWNFLDILTRMRMVEGVDPSSGNGNFAEILPFFKENCCSFYLHLLSMSMEILLNAQLLFADGSIKFTSSHAYLLII